MNVEMNSLGILQNEERIREGIIHIANYEDISVHFTVKEDGVHFRNCFEWKKENVKLFEKWHLKEKEMYEEYIINYFKEIDNINDVLTFEGKIIRENKSQAGPHYPTKYEIGIEYNHFPYNVSFTFAPSMNIFMLDYDVPVSINSEGEIAKKQLMNYILKEETIQRMWEPFRDKTNYRLQLLHMLR